MDAVTHGLQYTAYASFIQEMDDFNAKFICTCLFTTMINKCSLVITLQDVC
jgi:hypothetical protein